MPRVVTKQLAFPLAGVGRRGEYREQSTPPHTAPWAINVRGESTIEHRKRGGSRPGLVKYLSSGFGAPVTAIIPVTSVDSSSDRHRDLIVVVNGACYSVRSGSLLTFDTTWQTAGGVTIQTAAGEDIAWDSSVGASANSATERAGALYLVDTTLKKWNPLTGVVTTVAASGGTVPSGCSYVCLYRDRLFMYGGDHVWYCSRQGDPTDWDLTRDMDDVGRAVAGQVDRPGRIGEKITAIIPNLDASLFISSKNGIWLLRGDPTTGSMTMLSDEIGVISNTAWARSPEGIIAFLSNDGVYMMNGDGASPVRWSAERVPDELRSISATTNTITMTYEQRSRGFHLFITPTSGVGTHWFLDVDNKALWPVVFIDEHQPLSAARIESNTGDMSDVVVGCRDGFLRIFNDDAVDDDGVEFESHVLIGPIHLSQNLMEDAVLSEIHGVLSDNSGIVKWRVVVGMSAEDATDQAVAGIDAEMIGNEVLFVNGEWTEDRNRVARPRARGPWAIIWLASKSRWAYDSIALRINQLGRLR